MPGDIVGEVSIKVRPDTTKFSKELRAELQKVKDDFQVQIGLDTAKAKAEFQALKQRIESDDLDVKVNLKTNELSFDKQIDSVRKSTSKLVSELDRAKAAFEKSSSDLQKAHKAEIQSIARLRDAELKLFELRKKGLATASRTARAEVQIASLREQAAKATKRLAQAQDHNYRSMWNYFKVLGDSEKRNRRFSFSLSSILDPLKSVGSGAASVASNMAGMLSNVWLLIAALAVAGPLLTLISAALGVVVGAIGGLVAGIGSLAALAGGVFAAVALGLDGIKEAAEVLNPEIEHLQNTLNKTFKDGLTPVFERLRSLFPIIEDGLNRIAQRLVGFADGMSRFFTSVQGTAMLEQVFKNIDAALDPVLKSLANFVIEIMRVAATKDIMDAWASTISGVVDGITHFIQRAREMEVIGPAIWGVDKILRGMLSTLEEILLAGMEFLANAAPGIQSFFEEWGNLIGRLDWAAIGTAISDMFYRAGEAMRKIPQETLDKIVLGIEALANEVADFLESGGMEMFADVFLLALEAMIGFTAVLKALKPIIDLVQGAIDAFTWALDMLKTMFDNLGLTIKLIGQVMTGDWAGALETVKQISAEKMGETAGVMKTQAGSAAKGVVGEIQQMRDRLGPLWHTLPGPVKDAFNQMESVAKKGSERTANETGKMPEKAKGAMGDLGGTLQGSGRSLIDGFISGMRSMIGSVKSAARAAVSAARNFFPFSPAKEGPFSGKGYTLYSGRALAEDWAKGINDKAHLGTKAVENMMGATNRTATAEWNGHISSDGFGITGSVYEGVMAAFNGSRLQVDGNGMAKLVNKTNNRNTRR